MSALELALRHGARDGFTLEVNARIPASGVTALFGASGSGKTTVLDCIAGLRPDIEDAEILFDDTPWQRGASRLPPWRRPLGYVFQDARLFPHLDVRGNLDFAAERAAPGGFSFAQVVDWLELGPLLERTTTNLSAGQQQRVAIGRALMRNPRLLLLDEPLANLDSISAERCLAELTRISRESGLPMLYVSHRMEEVAAIADRLVLMDAGRVIDQGPLLELAGRLDTRLAEDESAAALLEVEVAGDDPRYSLTELRVNGASLWVAAGQVRGPRSRLRIPARDVSVCREAPGSSSILNVLPVVLSDMREVSKAHCMLRLQLGDQFLLARITRRSRDQLQLRGGEPLFAQIKSVALLRESPTP